MILILADLQCSIVSLRSSYLSQGVGPDLPPESGHLGLGLM